MRAFREFIIFTYVILKSLLFSAHDTGIDIPEISIMFSTTVTAV